MEVSTGGTQPTVGGFEDRRGQEPRFAQGDVENYLLWSQNRAFKLRTIEFAAGSNPSKPFPALRDLTRLKPGFQQHKVLSLP